MAASAYASVTSLLYLMDQVEQHQNLRIQIFFENQQIESLRQRVVFLQEFLEKFSHDASDEEAEVLERAIATAAQAAEDVIESHIVEQLRAASSDLPSASFVALRDLHQIIADMDSIKATVTEVQEKATTQRHSIPAANTLRPSPTGNNAMVGFDEKVIEIKARLTIDQHARQVIPIIGMGGVGKTTLAKAVYEDPLIVEQFDLRIWVTVSQGYSVKELLLQALNKKCDSRSSESEDRLGQELYKHLFGRKYLLVLDDIWVVEDWERIRQFFPDNNNKSRIVITSRLSYLGASFSSFVYNMDFLDEHKSWHLFCGMAFGSHSCPPELESIGKEIVEKCKGLPLSIVVIGGLLANSCTQAYWEDVAEDLNSILCSTNDNQCMSILSLSYSHLPVHLKPCFLYMGMFPEDDKISVSRLIRLWVAEGFLKPDKNKTLEEVARNYLKDLISRNLILVHEFGRSGNIKTCHIHDLLREMCVNIAHKEKVFCTKSIFNSDILQEIEREHRIVIAARHGNRRVNDIKTRFDGVKLVSLARSLLGNSVKCELQLVDNFQLLRIWDHSSRYKMPHSTNRIFHYNINIRCLHFTRINFDLVRALLYADLLWNLQTIVVGATEDDTIVLVPIWKMPQLRHIRIPRYVLGRPSNNELVLVNLQTLGIVQNFKCTKRVLKGIPNLRKLTIMYDDLCLNNGLDYCLNNIGRFQKLESFTCRFAHGPCYSDLFRKPTFPPSLKRLNLKCTALDWNDLKVIGCLPYLEVLKLDLQSVVGCEWNVVAGGFPSLKHLYISGCHELTDWVLDSSECFPVLETIILQFLSNLSEIPSGIAETPTLKLISVHMCSASTATSAVSILEEQFSMGNEDLQVRVFLGHKEHKSFCKKVDLDHLESYTRKNLEIS